MKPPPDAISAEEAAQTILSGVANKQGIIVVPESLRPSWLEYYKSPELGESHMRDLARQRRRSYETSGLPY